MIKKVTLMLFYCFTGFAAMSQNTGFFNNYVPNLQQYSQQTMYIDGPNMIIGGNMFAVVTQAATVLQTDTNGNFKSMWTLAAPSIQLYRCRKQSTNNCIVTGTMQSACGVSGYGFIGSFNYSTGTWNGGYAYDCNAQLGGFCTGMSTMQDGIALANGDLACVGEIDQTVTCCLGASSYGQYNCGVGTLFTGGNGYLDGFFGTGNYERGNDICLIRTGANGDTATASGGDGFVKKYSLAYSGGAGCGYTNPAQPTPIGHTTGTFNYVFSPTLVADSTRQDVAVSIIEDANHNMFICGYTYNYSSNNDYEGFVLKVNSAGATQWCHTFYLNATATAYEYMENMAFVTEDGSNDIICTMESFQSDNTEILRLSNATGNIIWSNSYNFSTQTWPFGIHLTTNKTIGTGYNEYLVGVIGVNFPGAPGSYDMAMMVIDDHGNVVSSIGEGMAPQDGANWSPDVDQAGTGSYFISSNTPYTGGTTNGSLVAKINRQNNTTGCATYQFAATPTITPRIV
ncbi:MAG TPA: hypothetical protein VK890_06460, partial [Bacteroidia bacterium]|nr:hypothetical protein [Bacteroidia bacterium]